MNATAVVAAANNVTSGLTDALPAPPTTSLPFEDAEGSGPVYGPITYHTRLVSTERSD
jgi:hypothetical protein